MRLQAVGNQGELLSLSAFAFTVYRLHHSDGEQTSMPAPVLTNKFVNAKLQKKQK